MMMALPSVRASDLRWRYLQAQQGGGIEAEDPGLVGRVEPCMKPHGIGFGHVEGIIGAKAQPVRSMGAHEAVEFVVVEYQCVEPEFAQIA